MILSSLLRGRNSLWNAAIIGSAVAAILINLIGLLVGIISVLPHLLYIPVVLVAYRYPRQGLIYSGILGGIYLLLVLFLLSSSLVIIGETLVRVTVMVIIGGLLAFLTLRLHEQESLYMGLFDHSEAGTILVRIKEDGNFIEEVNETAAGLLQITPEDLRGTSLSSFWNRQEEGLIFTRLASEGVVHASGAVFSTPDEDFRDVLVSLAPLPDHRAVLTFVDITSRVAAERALQAANEKLNLLSRISADRLHGSVDAIIETVDEASAYGPDSRILEILERIRTLAWDLARQIFLTEAYHDLGSSPPGWIRLQQVLLSSGPLQNIGDISLRIWVERLEVYADPLIGDVLIHLVENAVRHGGTVKNIVVSCHHAVEGLDLIIEDDGVGIQKDRKEMIFEYDAGGTAGLGLFICRQILAVTGISITETGREGQGTRFVIHIPEDNYRTAGSSEDAPPVPIPRTEGEGRVRGVPHRSGTLVRELTALEFPIAEELWVDYHETKGDPAIDRIFTAFLDGAAVSLARCRRHPDGLEVDAVFTPVNYRGHGYADGAVRGLVEACGWEALYMHSVRNLTGFYGNYGFVPIDEKELPPTIRERYAWAGGQMEGANVCPMKREVTPGIDPHPLPR